MRCTWFGPIDRYLIPLCTSAGTMPQVYPGTSLIIAASIATSYWREILPSTAGQPHQFLGAAERGELVAVEAVQMDHSATHRLQELLLFLAGRLLQITVHGPQHFASSI